MGPHAESLLVLPLRNMQESDETVRYLKLLLHMAHFVRERGAGNVNSTVRA